MKYILTAILLTLSISNNLWAQTTTDNSLFRESGKIYVVIAVIGLIFAGIIIYLVRLDMKLKQMENDKEL